MRGVQRSRRRRRRYDRGAGFERDAVLTARWFAADAVFDGHDVLPEMAVQVTQGRITGLRPAAGITAQRLRGTLAPAFVDLQVNGGGGVLFNHDPTKAGIAAIIAAHRSRGTAAIMPTLITDAPEAMQRAANAAIASRCVNGFAGIHFEGPHIAKTRRGTHAARYIRPLDDTTMAILADLRSREIPVMITLAPEAATTAQISALTQAGVIVSLGHSDADSAAADAAFAAGACAVTHLFNAMSGMQGRAPGLAGAAINSSAAVGIICDGVHVSDTMLALAIRARPHVDTTFLVSDAMPTVAGPDHFTLYGRDIRLEDGRLINAEGNLAGAHVTQAEGVARLITRVGIAAPDALRMAISTPARLIGSDHLAALTQRDTRDVNLLDPDWNFAGTLADLTG